MVYFSHLISVGFEYSVSCVIFHQFYINFSKLYQKYKNMLNLTKAEGNDLLLSKNNSKLFINETRNGGCVVLVNKLNYKKGFWTFK